MRRSFDGRPIDAEVLRRVLDAARRAPSAGNSQGWELLVLSDEADRGRYWDLTLPEENRAGFPWPGLLRAPVLVLPLAHEGAYRARYAEPDKAGSGLGVGGGSEWPVPYWLTDTAFGVMLMLLAAEDEGLGALFFGLFQAQEAVLAAFGVPEGLTPVGVVALGHPDGQDHQSASAQRGRRTVEDITHHGHW